MNRWTLSRVLTEPPPVTERREAPAEEPIAQRVQASRERKRKTPRWIPAGVAALVVAALLFLWLARRPGAGPAANGSVQRTATVERRDFVQRVRIHGTVEAVQSFSVMAPRLAGQGGGSMVITKLIAPGSMVRQGDFLVEFDRQNQVKNAFDRRAEFVDFEEQIKRRRAEQAAAIARDDTELKQAENALEAAAIEMRRNEVLSRIETEKNQQNLEEARARLDQLRETYQLKRLAAEASLHILEIQRDRARNAMLHAERNAERLSIRAPLPGMVVFNSFWKNGAMGEVQEGDEVRPGQPFLQVVDPSRMQVRAKVNQADVASLRSGQTVEVRLDAYPELRFPGRVETIAAIGVAGGFSPKVRSFSATVSIQGADPRLLPDLSAALDIELERRPGALVAPRDAVVTENGRHYLLVQIGSGYDRREVRLAQQSASEVLVESGVEAGAMVLRGGAANGGLR